MRNAPPHTPLYVLVHCSSSSAKHYILLGCLAKVDEKLSNWSGLPKCLLLVFPVLSSRKSASEKRKVGMTLHNALPQTPLYVLV